MTTANIQLNPSQVTNAAGLFSTTTDGYVAGCALDSPSARNALQGGILNPTATVPVWGGCGITASLPTPGTESGSIGAVLDLATSQANLTGFTVFDQSAAMIQTPNSPAPLAPSGGSINFYAFGSGARIVVPCDQAVAAALAGQPQNTLLYWDYTNQKLLATAGGTAIAAKLIAVDSSGVSKVLVYSSGTGFATWNNAGYAVVIQI